MQAFFGMCRSTMHYGQNKTGYIVHLDDAGQRSGGQSVDRRKNPICMSHTLQTRRWHGDCSFTLSAP